MRAIRLLPILAAFAAPTLPLYGQAACPTPWRLEETLRMGSVNGDVVFTLVTGLDLGPDGEVLVAQALVPEVAVFTPQGRRSRTIGRGGSGPGEFQITIGEFGWKGDTLWVTDVYNTHLFGPDGKPAGRISFRAPVQEEGSYFVPGAPLADGSFLGSRIIRDFERYAIGNPTLAVHRFSRTGEVLGTIALVDWTDKFVRYDGGDGRMRHAEHPLKTAYYERELWKVIPDGSAIIKIGEVRRDRRSASFDLLRIGIGGDTLLKRTIPFEPRPVTRAEAARIRDVFAAWQAGDFDPPGNLRTSPAVAERRRRAARSAIDFPSHHPPVRQIRTGHDGTIWLLRELRPDRVDVWEVYDASGRLEGTVQVSQGKSSSWLPWAPRLEILRATRDEIWGTTVDDLDVSYIHRYRVDRSCR